MAMAPAQALTPVEAEEVTVEKPTIEEYIRSKSWDGDVAYAVMMAESRERPTVVNPEQHRGCRGSVGLFQIACIHDDVEKLKDPYYNIDRAHEIWQQQGWRPWGAYTNKSYLKFM